MDRYKITIIQTNPKKLIYKGVEDARSEQHAKQLAEDLKEYYKGKFVQESDWIAEIEKLQPRF